MILASILLAGCGRVDAAPQPDGGVLSLPAPSTSGAMTLEQAIAARRSERAFGGAESAQQLSQLLWAAQGVTDKATGKRAAPSAGALYALDVYVARADGLYRYRPGAHVLDKVASADRRAAIAKASLDQEPVRTAPTLLVMFGVPSRLRGKYGDRSERYVYLEAGHAAQNVLLQAHALGLAAVPVGAFDDDALRQAIGAEAGAVPVYVIPIGRRP